MPDRLMVLATVALADAELQGQLTNVFQKLKASNPPTASQTPPGKCRRWSC